MDHQIREVGDEQGAVGGLSEATAWLKRNPPWKVGLVYAVSAFAGLGHIDLVTARLGAPDWLFALALVLSLIGLAAVLFVAAALRRGVPFRRFAWVSVGGLAIGWWLLSLIDELVDRAIVGSDMYPLALFAYVLILPIGLSAALLWPVQPEAQAAEDDAVVGE